MKKTLISILIIFIFALFAVFVIMKEDNSVYANSFTESIRKAISSVFFVDSITPEKMKEDFSKALLGARKIGIVIVPGHDDKTVGAQFGNLRETDLNAELAEKISNLLSKNPEFNVTLMRNKNGYNPLYLEYLEKNESDINAFISGKKAEMNSLLNSGLIDHYGGVIHNVAPKKTILSLYGMNKWANDNNADLVIHIHFNDYPGHKSYLPGKYNGFAVYVPEKQYSNAKASWAIGDKIMKSLSKHYEVSNLPKEREGMIPDQDLIAIGSYNTLDSAGILVEYGYIYESQFQNSSIREHTLDDLAHLTYEGIMSFFDDNFNSKPLPYIADYKWNKDMFNGMNDNKDVWHMQAVLREIGFYPPSGRDPRDCPVNGNFGPCTESSLRAFQAKKGLPQTGYGDWKTRVFLGETASLQN